MAKMRYRNLIFVVLIAVCLTVVSGCLKKDVVVDGQVDSGEQIGDVATSTDEIDTSDWKTYRNEEYGFELRYPGGWEYEKKVYRDEDENIVDTGLIIHFNTNQKMFFEFSASTLAQAKNLDKTYYYEPSYLLTPIYFKESPYFSFMSSEKWEYEKDIFEGKKDKKSCKREHTYLLCYDYNLPGASFNRYDMIYYNNTRYEFEINISEGIIRKDLKDFSSQNINKKANEIIMNKFMLDRFNEIDDNNIELIEKIKETLSFID